VSPNSAFSKKLLPEWKGPTTEIIEMLLGCRANLANPSGTGSIEEWFAVGLTTWKGTLKGTSEMHSCTSKKADNHRPLHWIIFK